MGQPLFWDDCEVSSEEEGDDSFIPSVWMEEDRDDEEWCVEESVFDDKLNGEEEDQPVENMEAGDGAPVRGKPKVTTCKFKILVDIRGADGSTTKNEESIINGREEEGLMEGATKIGVGGTHEIKQKENKLMGDNQNREGRKRKDQRIPNRSRIRTIIWDWAREKRFEKCIDSTSDALEFGRQFRSSWEGKKMAGDQNGRL
ncbi:hypothetical protein L6452_28335 [Arctium lappa]|uniref:Uncharacterized protein n=1 Tax=Arctium lappa TaxID=4217 RepID=A0ACB8ZY70_ARCLA|nr:hypothetical protein L6452_28335 [Arctium lappa]